MMKTYLYIPEELNKQIIHTAKTQKKSKAAVIRLAIEIGINTPQIQENSSAKVLLKLAELGKKYKVHGPKDNSSQRIDELLWGKDWSKDE